MRLLKRNQEEHSTSNVVARQLLWGHVAEVSMNKNDVGYMSYITVSINRYSHCAATWARPMSSWEQM